jgi:hypothetical protein
MQAIERLTEMLTLPGRVAVHTPFTICMIATTTIAHLSACKHVLHGEDLKIARERIRVAMGALEIFAEVWPRGKKVVRDVKTVARELLSLAPSTTATLSKPLEIQPLPKSVSPHIQSNSPTISADQFSPLESSGYFDFPSMDAELSAAFVIDDWNMRTGFPFNTTTQY